MVILATLTIVFVEEMVIGWESSDSGADGQATSVRQAIWPGRIIVVIFGCAELLRSICEQKFRDHGSACDDLPK
jgi:hypothetical protein